MSAASRRQVGVMLQKEFLTMKHAPCVTFCEFCCPGTMGVMAAVMFFFAFINDSHVDLWCPQTENPWDDIGDEACIMRRPISIEGGRSGLDTSWISPHGGLFLTAQETPMYSSQEYLEQGTPVFGHVPSGSLMQIHKVLRSNVNRSHVTGALDGWKVGFDDVKDGDWYLLRNPELEDLHFRAQASDHGGPFGGCDASNGITVHWKPWSEGGPPGMWGSNCCPTCSCSMNPTSGTGLYSDPDGLVYEIISESDWGLRSPRTVGVDGVAGHSIDYDTACEVVSSGKNITLDIVSVMQEWQFLGMVARSAGSNITVTWYNASMPDHAGSCSLPEELGGGKAQNISRAWWETSGQPVKYPQPATWSPPSGTEGYCPLRSNGGFYVPILDMTHDYESDWTCQDFQESDTGGSNVYAVPTDLILPITSMYDPDPDTNAKGAADWMQQVVNCSQLQPKYIKPSLMRLSPEKLSFGYGTRFRSDPDSEVSVLMPEAQQDATAKVMRIKAIPSRTDRDNVKTASYLQHKLLSYLYSQNGNVEGVNRVAISEAELREDKGNQRGMFGTYMTMFAVFAFIMNQIIPATRLVEEKRTRARELLKVMGMRHSTYVAGHVSAILLFQGLTIILFIIPLAATGGLESGDILPCYLFCVLFAVALLSVSFFVAALFTSTLITIFVAVFFYIAGYALISFGVGFGFSKTAQWFICLHPVSSFVYGMFHFFSAGQGVAYIEIGDASVMLMIDAVIYFCLAQYVGAVFPGPFGIPKKWNFLCMPKQKGKTDMCGLDGLPIPPARQTDPANMQRVEDGSEVVIRMRGVTKQFPGCEDTPAVHRLGLDIHGGQIFVLLGHNGAGKTTTFNLLTGQLPITAHEEGGATINGLDISSEMQRIRDDIGVCPQHDVLFDALSVEEHLKLYYGIRPPRAGVTSDTAARDMVRALSSLGAPLEGSKLAKNLSGGMKRRLSLGIALISQPGLVFLDEPSSGLDPVSRRGIWSIIQAQKARGATVVLTTHFMEEAEVLGDRVGIMTRGSLYCCGNPAFLKGQFGCGYYLNASLKDEGDVATEQRLAEEVKRHVPGAEQQPRHGKELVHVLPQGAVTQFGALFTAIEADAQLTAGLSDTSVRQNTLEDVFIDVALREAPGQDDPAVAKAQQEQLDFGMLPGDEVRERAGGPALMATQMRALWRRRVLSLRRNRLALCFGFFAPVVIILGGMLLLTSAGDPGTQVEWRLPEEMQLDAGGDGDGSGSGGGRGRFARPLAAGGTGRRATPRVLAAQWDSSEPSPGMGGQNDGDLYLIMADFVGDGRVGALKDAMASAHTKLGGGKLVWQDVDKPLDFNQGKMVPFFYGVKGQYGCGEKCPRGGLLINSGNDTVLNITTFKTENDHRYEYDDPRFDTGTKGIPHYLIDLVHAAHNTMHGGTEPPVLTEIAEQETGWNWATDPNNAIRICQANSDCFSGVPGQPGISMRFCSKVCYTGGCGKGQAAQPGQAAPLGSGYCQKCVYTNPADGHCSSGSQSVDGNCDACGGTQPWEGYQRIVHYSFDLDIVAVLWMIGIMTGPCFLVMDVSEDVGSSIYMHLRVIGMNPAAYWLATLIFDFSLGFISCVLTFLILSPGMSAYPLLGAGMGAVVLLVFFTYTCLCLQSCLWAVLMGHRVKPVTSLKLHMALNLTFMLLPLVITEIANLALPSRKHEAHEDLDKAKPHVKMVLPQSAYWTGMSNLGSQWAQADTEKSVNSDRAFDYEHGTGRPILALFLHNVWMSLGLAFAIWWKERTPKKSAAAAAQEDREASVPFLSSPDGEYEAMDEDVRAELQRVRSGADDLTVADSLAKTYPNGCTAVKSVSFGIKVGECFGLLGPNGAGKTTTIKMLIGEELPTKGSITFPKIMRGVDATAIGRKELYRKCAVAVCPQHDALWATITAREHMEIYLAMRYGAAAQTPGIGQFIRAVAAKLSFVEHVDKVAGAYSGGTKRKLGVALSMFTGSHLAFLDEPSTGMDPFSRRALWDGISTALTKQEDAGVLLTTHSMEEASSCCQRIAIQTDGALRCIGSDNHLKARFGSGYTLVVYLGQQGDGADGAGSPQHRAQLDARIQPLEADLRALFPALGLLEEQGLQRRYRLGVVHSFGKCFQDLGNLQQRHGIESYSISQNSSLEHIFMAFTGVGAVVDQASRATRTSSIGPQPPNASLGAAPAHMAGPKQEVQYGVERSMEMVQSPPTAPAAVPAAEVEATEVEAQQVQDILPAC